MQRFFKWPARIDSLFTRIFLIQLGLVLALGLVFGGLFYVERNTTVATLYADRWAAPLARASGMAASTTAQADVIRRESAPAAAHRPLSFAPRFVALRGALAAQGVHVDDVMVSLGPPEPIVWLRTLQPTGAPVWLGVAGQLVEPAFPKRLLIAFSAFFILLIGVSWAFARRLTRPLEHLRERMHSHTPGERAPPATEGDVNAPRGSPEIAAIDTAYTDLLARLKGHERERSMLLAGVSHDLRSPLGRIRLAAALLPDLPENSARKAVIIRNVQDADQLIGNFLDYVRTGELALDETVDLSAVARGMRERLAQSAQTITVNAPARLQWPRSNALLVERLMANLVDNALKYGRPPVTLSVGLMSGGAFIEVEDAGPGMAPDEVHRLQEAFTRGDQSRLIPGTGLGLAIVRQIVARFGGSVSLESRPSAYAVRVSLLSLDRE
jgi:two-component system, OmpR family, osmolarity sensor histidine kinase EnvZ